eukprot:g17291.t1
MAETSTQSTTAETSLFAVKLRETFKGKAGLFSLAHAIKVQRKKISAPPKWQQEFRAWKLLLESAEKVAELAGMQLDAKIMGRHEEKEAELAEGKESTTPKQCAANR